MSRNKLFVPICSAEPFFCSEFVPRSPLFVPNLFRFVPRHLAFSLCFSIKIVPGRAAEQIICSNLFRGPLSSPKFFGVTFLCDLNFPGCIKKNLKFSRVQKKHIFLFGCKFCFSYVRLFSPNKLAPSTSDIQGWTRRSGTRPPHPAQ